MSFWTSERIATLKRLALDGHTAQEIAMTLRTTRSAVLGKAHRLGIPLGTGKGAKRAALASSVKTRAAKAKPTLPKIAPTPVSTANDAIAEKVEDRRETVAMPGVASEAVAIPVAINPQPSGDMQGQSSAGVTLFDLRRNSCRWPIAGEGIGTFFCGDPVVAGCSYCADHKARSVTKSGGGAFVFNRTNTDRRAAA